MWPQTSAANSVDRDKNEERELSKSVANARRQI